VEYLESFKKTILFILIIVFPIAILSVVLSKSVEDKTGLEILKEKYSEKHIPSADHSKHSELQKDFTSPHDVTAACLKCHTERGKEVMATAHWNWEREEYIAGRGITYLGKKNLMNNFCTGVLSNEGSCNKCHAGYGWANKDFDFKNPYNIDCLVCHDQIGTYEKATGGAGYPPTGENAPDYKKIAQHIGIPRKENCGFCHFGGGGGNNVKHGDLEEALLNCDKKVDVHMGKDGLDMACITCHVTRNHKIKGKYYGTSSSNNNRAKCEDCHGDFPHTNNRLNEHTLKVDCRTCHIPTYAKVNPTKMYWDWSTAGKKKDGKAYSTEDPVTGKDVYLSIKGNFKWEKDVKPDYVWFNGTADHYLMTDKITADTLNINTLFGGYADKNAKIVPIKIHRGKQPYDLVYKTLIQAKLWDKESGKGAFWLDLDLEASFKAGMAYAGYPYSGKHGYIDTKMYLPINHMVSKSEDALKCEDCHTRNNSRLKDLNDFYMPGKTHNATVESLGFWIILLAFLGVFGHASLRFVFNKRKN